MGNFKQPVLTNVEQEKPPEITTNISYMEKQSNLKTTNIRGKNYVEVHARVAFFRKNCADHRLTTEIVSINDDKVLMKSTVWNQHGEPVSTGFASEEKNSSHINKTSFIENCETSAVGRALALFGIGTESSIASALEVGSNVYRDYTDKIGKMLNDGVAHKKIMNSLKHVDLSDACAVLVEKGVKPAEVMEALRSAYKTKVQK